MSLSEFPPLPKSSHARKRSASDPACFTSTIGTPSSEEATAFKKTIAILDAIEKAKARADKPKAARKDSGIGISNGVASLDGVIDQLSEAHSDSAYKNATSKFGKNAAGKACPQKTVSSFKSNQSAVEASKDISKLSPKELKA